MGRTDFADCDVDIFCINKPDNKLGNTIAKHRERLKITQEGLSELSGLSVATIRRIETGAIIRPKIEFVLVICIALKLDELYCFDLIKKSCNASFFEVLDEVAIVYLKIIREKNKRTVEYWNNYLENIGMKPLLNTRMVAEK